MYEDILDKYYGEENFFASFLKFYSRDGAFARNELIA